jgi:hypothetical protein
MPNENSTYHLLIMIHILKEDKMYQIFTDINFFCLEVPFKFKVTFKLCNAMVM